MLNTIKYYYNLNDLYIFTYKNKKYIKSNNKIYQFCEVHNISETLEAYKITNKYQEYEKILLNKEGQVFTKYNNKVYVLIEKKHTRKNFPITRMLVQEGKYMLDKSNWIALWTKKTDYIEYTAKHINGKYGIIDESINYFIGMAETAIAYLKNNKINTQFSEKVICRRQLEESEYYNPINIIIDYQARDISEYLKKIFWTNEYTYDKIHKILETIKNSSKNDYILIYARLIFPNFYFNKYIQVLENNSLEEIKIIINRLDEYENYVKSVFNILKEKDKSLKKIEWL